MINSIQYHTYDYDKNYETLNCNTIEYIKDNNTSYGIIQNFLLADEKHFCIIRKFNILVNDSFYNKLDELSLMHINKFFLMVEFSNESEIIECKNIMRRCIFVEYLNNKKNEIILMPCCDLNEHD